MIDFKDIGYKMRWYGERMRGCRWRSVASSQVKVVLCNTREAISMMMRHKYHAERKCDRRGSD